jgi:hypothetical protein
MHLPAMDLFSMMKVVAAISERSHVAHLREVPELPSEAR